MRQWSIIDQTTTLLSTMELREHEWLIPDRARLTFCYRQFSLVPRRVMDGSESGDLTPAAVLSGAPVDLQARTVRYATSHFGGMGPKLTPITVEYIGPQRQLRNLATGMAITGEWIGTYCRKDTDGRIL